MPSVLHKYVDNGRACFANVALESGERVLLSAAGSSLAIFRLHLGGRLPGRRLFGIDALRAERLARVLARDTALLPILPKATKVHRDEAAMVSFLDAALTDLNAVAAGKPVLGAVDALDVDNPPERPLSLFTRLALTARDAADCARLFERASNTPG